MHYLQLFFADRAEPILIPVTEKDGHGIVDQFRDRSTPLGFMEFGSVVEQHIWANGKRIRMARLLLDMDQVPFDPKAIASSKQFPDDENKEPELSDVRWEVTFWLREREEPLTVSDLSGHDWVEIYTSCDSDEQFLVVQDEDGEELVLRVADIDLLSGLEVDRYSIEQLHAISKLGQDEEA